MKKLMPHQVAGVAFLEKVGGRAMLADDMGLGKTATVLSYLKKNKIKALVVTTKSFLYGWKHEASLWYPEASVEVIKNAKMLTTVADGSSDLILMTYETMTQSGGRSHLPEGVTTVVFDESHKLMHSCSKRSVAARRLVVGKKHVVCLTGTPQPNGRPRQLWHQFLLVGPRFVRWADFASRFCQPRQVWAPYAGRYVWTYDGATNLDELRELVAPRLLRRTKDILSLPLMTQSVVSAPVKLTKPRGEGWATYAERLALKKVPYALSLVQDCLDRGSKVVVFCNNRSVRDAVHAAFPTALKLAADMGAEDRSHAVSEFQHGSQFTVFCATTQIASEGLTLTAADVVIFVDLPWQPGQLEQAKARVHRKGQTKPTHAYVLQSDTFYDKIIATSLSKKQTVTERLLDEGKERDADTTP